MPAASAALPLPRDRRQAPRLLVGGAIEVELSIVTEIDLLDLSASGVLLSCTSRPNVGQRTRIHTLLGEDPFVAWIEVRRIEEVRPATPLEPVRYLAGAVFTALDDQSAATLRRFLPSRRRS